MIGRVKAKPVILGPCEDGYLSVALWLEWEGCYDAVVRPRRRYKSKRAARDWCRRWADRLGAELDLGLWS